MEFVTLFVVCDTVFFGGVGRAEGLVGLLEDGLFVRVTVRLVVVVIMIGRVVVKLRYEVVVSGNGVSVLFCDCWTD